MKRTLWLAMILLLVCVFAFFACDNSGDTPQAPNNTPSGATDNTTESETDAHIHTFGEWITVKDATCTIKGEQERSCSCGEKETQSIDATGHTEVTDEAVAATCTTDGKTEGRHCSVCNETLIAQSDIPASHAEGEWVIDTNASCTGNGSKHQVCSVCEATIKTETLTKLGHTDGEWIIDKEANCTEGGSKHQVCSVCFTTLKTENSKPKGHTYTSITTPPTYIEKGYTTHTCLCGDVYIDNYVDPIDVLIISNTQTISNQIIDADVYVTSTGKATFNNVTVNGNIYCYGQLKMSGCVANDVYAYAYGSMMSCGAFDGTHGKISGGIKCNRLTILDNALDYAFNKWGKK